MFKVSDEYKKEIEKLGGRNFLSKVIIRDKEYTDDNIIDMNLEESVNPSDNFSLGSVVSNTFEINLIDVDTNVIFEDATIKPYIGLELENKIEYIPLGIFTVDDVTIKNKKVKLECVDNMIKLERAYFSDLKYPCNINEVLKEICRKANITCNSILPNYSIDEIKGYSFRQAIGIIATLSGCFARFNRIGELEIISYTDAGLRITPDAFFKFETNDKDYIIEKITAKKGEKTFSKGANTGILIDNPVITEGIVNDLYNKFKDFTYRPYTLSWQGNPAVQAGDRVTIVDVNGKEYNTLIMEQKLTYNGGIKSELKASGKTESSDKFDSKGSITQAMENYSIEQASIKKALIQKASIDELSVIDAKINNLYTQDLIALKANIKDLQSNKISTVEFNATKAEIQTAIISKADINLVDAQGAKINTLEAKTISVEKALAGNLTAKNFHANAITAGSGIIAEGAIGSAQISSLTVNKLEAGDITTSKHRIVSADGTIEIVGNQILINRNNLNRVILGEYKKQDNTTDYGLLIRSKDGKTIMLDSEGVHNAGITDGAINNNKVADNANIAGNKLDINSVIREVNGATETIKGTKVQIGDRTLDIELSTQNNTIKEHGKELSTQKASILALDDSFKLKVDNQTFKETTSKINSSITIAKDESNKYTNDVGSKLKADSEKYANDVATAKSQLATEQVKAYADGKISIEEQARIRQAHDNLNSAIGRVNQAKAEAMETAEKDATNKSNLVKTYADQVAKAKADLAEANAIANADGKISDEEKKRIKQATDNLNTAIARADKSKADSKIYSDSLGQQLKSNAEKYANDVATTKSELAKQQAIANADGKISIEEKARIKQAQDNLNSSIGRANEAEQKAKVHADQVAEQKKNEALSAANVYTNAQITTTNSNLSKATSEINILKDTLSTKVGQTDVDKSISEIKFSDVNMIKNGGEFKNTDDWSITNGEKLYIENNFLVAKFKKYANWGCYVCNYSLKDKQLDPLKKYTVVCKLKADKNKAISFNICDGGGQNYVYSKNLELTPEWQIFKFTFNPAQKGNERQFRFITGKGEDFDLHIGFAKMVEGATASDVYTQSPEDINQAIIDSAKVTTDKITTVETELKQTKESFGVSVRDLNSKTTTIETNLVNTNNNLSNKINSAKTDAFNSAKGYTNGQIGNVNNTINSVKGTTELLAKGLKKWIFKAYDKGSLNNFEPPNIGMTIGRTLLWNREISDADMTSYKDFGSNYLGYCKTNVYLDAAYNWNTSLRTDDAGAVYLNGSLVSTTTSCSAKNIIMSFKQGWNTVEVLWVEVGGEDGFNFASSISTLSQIKIMNAYNVADSKADVRYLNDDITNKYNSSVSHADSVATSKSNAAKNEAINSANSYTNSAKQQAIDSAKTYTNTQITTVNSKVSNVQSSLNVLKNEINTKVSQSDIDKTVDNIKIGGRNLIINSGYCKDLKYWNKNVGGGSTSKEIFLDNGKNGEYHGPNLTNIAFSYGGWCILSNESLNNKKFKFDINEKYTVSGLIWTNNKGNVDFQIADGDSLNCVISSTIIINGWGYAQFTFTFTPTVGGNTNLIRFCINKEGQSIFIPYIKLVKGNMISDWTAAPEDINQEIQDNITTVTEKIKTAESTFTQKTNNINATVSSVQQVLNTKADGSTVSSLQSQLSKLDIATDGIRTEVSKKTDRNNIISAINQSAESIKIDASKIELSGITTFSNRTGLKAIEIKNNAVDLYNFNKNGEQIGSLTAAVLTEDKSKPSINLVNYKNSSINIGFFDRNLDNGSESYLSYITFDKYKIRGNACSISIYEDLSIEGHIFYLSGKKRNAFFESTTDTFIVKAKHGFQIEDTDSGKITALLSSDKAAFSKWNQNHYYAEFYPGGFNFVGNDGNSVFWLKDGSRDIYTKTGVNMRIQGDLSVRGSKNRIVETMYGDLKLNAVESAECWFTDILIEEDRTDNNGDCIIWFDNKFLSTVNTRYKYKIDVTPIGEFASNGKVTYVRVVEKTEKYFKVRGTPNTLFDWTITTKQKGYERDRLEKAS